MKKHPYAIVSLILGLSSFFYLLNLDKALMAIIFGLIAGHQIEKSDGAYSGHGFTYAGFVFAGIYIALVIYQFYIYKASII
ncbi:MAG: DUF4190 domain-containing protein [Elusimicrobia bacterium]|nr:DUF4190 domain-containing protein [Elusimicrobiota bacterium]